MSDTDTDIQAFYTIPPKHCSLLKVYFCSTRGGGGGGEFFIYLLYIFCHVLHFSLVLETWMFFLNSREPDTWFYNGILPQGFFFSFFPHILLNDPNQQRPPNQETLQLTFLACMSACGHKLWPLTRVLGPWWRSKSAAKHEHDFIHFSQSLAHFLIFESCV